METKKTYSEQLKDPRWQKKRLEIMQRDNFTCQKCGDKESTLNIHHVIYQNGKKPWEYLNNHLVTLCEHCHKEVEILKQENGTINFNLIKIFKSMGWSGSSRIMFVSIPGVCDMSIYDNQNNLISGFIFKADNEKIKEIFEHAIL